jgi:23S rRNA pseudouridine1911/1915/1917 synthase
MPTDPVKTPTKLQIEYEDNHLIVINKKSGVLVQGDRTGDMPLSEMVKLYLKEQYHKPGNVFCGVLHRLDRPVTGLVMLAKTSKGLVKMNDLFRRREVHKIYWAITKHPPDGMTGKLTHWLIKDPARNRTHAHDKPRGAAQKAELHYQILGTLNRHWLLDIRPTTGRPHQIRAQLAAVGCPISGDIKYGSAAPNPDASIHLHARQLRFEHPIKREPVVLEAGLPQERLWRQFSTFENRLG